MHPYYDVLVEAASTACQQHYGARLVSVAVFGSVGRRTPGPDSDIDLVVVAEQLPRGRLARSDDFAAVERSLKDLQVDYLDLYLIHFPICLKYVPPTMRYPAGWFFDPDAPVPKMETDSVPIHETWRAREFHGDLRIFREGA